MSRRKLHPAGRWSSLGCPRPGSRRPPSASWPSYRTRRSRPCPTWTRVIPWRTRPSGPPTPIRGGWAAPWRARCARSAPCTAGPSPSAASSPPWRPVPRTGRRPRAGRPSVRVQSWSEELLPAGGILLHALGDADDLATSIAVDADGDEDAGVLHVPAP